MQIASKRQVSCEEAPVAKGTKLNVVGDLIDTLVCSEGTTTARRYRAPKQDDIR